MKLRKHTYTGAAITMLNIRLIKCENYLDRLITKKVYLDNTYEIGYLDKSKYEKKIHKVSIQIKNKEDLIAKIKDLIEELKTIKLSGISQVPNSKLKIK